MINKPSNTPFSLALTQPRYISILAICSMGIVGCQSLPVNSALPKAEAEKGNATVNANYYQNVLNTTQSYDELFDSDASLHRDRNAQAQLIDAVKRHLTSDHIAISQMRVKDTPFIDANSIDEGSTSLLKTVVYEFIKSLDVDATDLEYDENESEDESQDYEPYRDLDSYMSQPDKAYFNYIDELAMPSLDDDQTPDAEEVKFDRRTGMSDSYIDKTDSIMSYISDSDDCVRDYSYELDQLMLSDSLFETGNEAFLTAKSPIEATYKACLTSVEESFDAFDTLMAESEGYQGQYLNEYKDCSRRYDTNLVNLLRGAATTKDIDFDTYDTIYESYEACYDGIWLRNELEPAKYIIGEFSHSDLEYTRLELQCSDELTSSQVDLTEQGLTYATHPQDYVAAYDEFLECGEMTYDLADSNNDSSNSYENDWDDDSYSDDESDFDSQYGSVLTQLTEKSEVKAAVQNVSKLVRLPDIMGQGIDSEDILSKVIDWFHLTPKQIEARNAYINQYKTLTSFRSYSYSKKQINSVNSYDYTSPTVLSTMQLPMGLDFNKGSLTIDASSIIPITPLFSPEYAPLPEDMKSNILAFKIPQSVDAQLIPSNVFYEILIASLYQSLGELDSSRFTPVDITHDAYAQKLGAETAIKINLGGKQTGQLMGSLVKYMGQGIEDYVAELPESDANELDIKEVMQAWDGMSKKFQTDDVGTVFQLIEAVIPISFNQDNTYYLDENHRLIAKQNNTSLGTDITGSTAISVVETRYDHKPFNSSRFRQHPLADIYWETFGTSAKPAIDGNQWIADMLENKRLHDLAEEARNGYQNENEDTE